MTDEILPGNWSVPASFLGRFDNYLTYADKQFDVTVSDNPTSGSIAGMFSTSPELTERWNSGASFPVVITIDFDADVHYWKVIGINFIYNRYATNVKMEVYRSDTEDWETLLDISGNTSHQVYAATSKSYVQQIRYTISGIHAGETEIAVEELFGMNYHYRGQGWVDRGGDSIFGQLKLSGDDIPHLDKQDIVDAIWKFEDGMWNPDGLEPDDSFLNFRDSDENKEKQFFLITESQDDEIEPLLATNTGLVVQKDIGAGGFLTSNQGELWLGSGRADQVDVPKIVLMHSGKLRTEGVPAGLGGSSFPTNPPPSAGDYFFRTDQALFYKYNGSSWDNITVKGQVLYLLVLRCYCTNVPAITPKRRLPRGILR